MSKKRQLQKAVHQAYIKLTSPLRLMPNFIIIGSQRGGTTSLFKYLEQHPLIIPSTVKEVHFFDINYHKNINWYRSHFPSLLRKNYIKQNSGQNIITFEASPYYMAHPLAPKRIADKLPEVKLIALLRNPVDRAYSHYQHSLKFGSETLLSFEKALAKEKERTDGEVEKMLKDETYSSFKHRAYSYLSRGVYVDQLKVWFDLFPKEQILILNSEYLYENPSACFKEILKFLELPEWEPKEYKEYNSGLYSKIAPNTREYLIDYFEPHNQRLYEYLGKNFGWSKAVCGKSTALQNAFSVSVMSAIA